MVIRSLFRPYAVAVLACTMGLGGGCRRKADTAASQPASNAQAKYYAVRGKIVMVDAEHKEIVLDAAAIPGFMEAMTMPYKLKNPSIITELHAGDSITATLIAADDSDLLDQIVIIAQA